MLYNYANYIIDKLKNITIKNEVVFDMTRVKSERQNSNTNLCRYCCKCRGHGHMEPMKGGHVCPHAKCTCGMCQRVNRRYTKNSDPATTSHEEKEKITKYCRRCRGHGHVERAKNHVCPHVKCTCETCKRVIKFRNRIPAKPGTLNPKYCRRCRGHGDIKPLEGGHVCPHVKCTCETCQRVVKTRDIGANAVLNWFSKRGQTPSGPKPPPTWEPGKTYSYVLVDMNIKDNNLKKVIYAGIADNPSGRLRTHGGKAAQTYEYRNQNTNADVQMIVIGKYSSRLKASEDEYISTFMSDKMSLVPFLPGIIGHPLSPVLINELKNNTKRQEEIEACITDGIETKNFVTRDQIIYCPICGADFICVTSLRFHAKKHTLNKRFRCPLEGCGSRSYKKYILRAHLRLVHALEIESIRNILSTIKEAEH